MSTSPQQPQQTTPLAAIVLCAGQGTRMKSALPKILHPLLGRPMGSYPLTRALETGATRAVAVTGHGAEQVERALTDALANRVVDSGDGLRFVRQEQQLGTAHAVLCAQPALADFTGDIFILYGDVPLVSAQTLRALIDAKAAAQSPVALVTTRPSDPTGYGRIVRDAVSGAMTRIVEHKDATEDELGIGEINAGLYLVSSDFLWRSLGRVDRRNAQNELYLTDLIQLAFEQSTPAATVRAEFEEVGGVNDRVELTRATTTLQRRINERHQRAGVTIELPDTVLIDESVELAADVTIGPNVRLVGGTRIERGAHIGQGCVIVDSIVGEAVEVKPYSVFEEAIVGEAAIVGPFARLRPGTELGAKVHIGNFVETKKARVGVGSKANHLSYLGDCDIGAGVNVGAGTITCNYDGVNKHRTVLGDGVFVGSDSQFVAPVTVGNGAYIGAGSTITEDVPEESLALSRGRQIVKEGYRSKRQNQKKRG
ncbi:MAG: bifunctional UDP-N-acetylglucosamine diphosphorylase/glucosamine-1-phosphate N-acetyltransferase GlmU [Myxococcales bacterium]|jgi:bifunctional UDP-N-acetylglucosamine pyrophosphorylase/glucosamine-1-phosphate N-acetyltransferase|nr:bifunctional UDP-N-acetylglucosamine diphosphorylase/glucosamine-1-phosphate N-acetyltransferase GlmU [Myxococcales bacterium]